MTITSDNHTSHGIQSQGERYFWITYLIIVVISSLVGDTIILFASIKHNAIKLNKIIVVVMQHIAVCDLLSSAAYVLPTTISLISERWVLGDVLAHVSLYVEVVTFQAANILICLLSTSKVLLLRYPLHTRRWTKNGAHKVCGMIWVFVHFYPVLRFLLDVDGLVFSHTTYNINFGLSSKSSSAVKVIAILTTLLTLDIPTIVVVLAVFSTLIFIYKSRNISSRCRGRRRWQGIVTVVVTATVYCISVVPSSIVTLVSMSDSQKLHFIRVAEFLIALNVMANFYIYSLTIPSFRNFLQAKALEVSGSISQFLTSSRTLEYELGTGHVTSVFTRGNELDGDNLELETTVRNSEELLFYESYV